jgi:hypothetical protein
MPCEGPKLRTQVFSVLLTAQLLTLATLIESCSAAIVVLAEPILHGQPVQSISIYEVIAGRCASIHIHMNIEKRSQSDSHVQAKLEQ